MCSNTAHYLLNAFHFAFMCTNRPAFTIAVSDEDVKAAAAYVYHRAVAQPSGSYGADLELKFDDALSTLLRQLFKQLSNYRGKSKEQLAPDRRELADQVVFGVM
jgi:hypothetical protein